MPELKREKRYFVSWAENLLVPFSICAWVNSSFVMGLVISLTEVGVVDVKVVIVVVDGRGRLGTEKRGAEELSFVETRST